jgi:hypothetical protein
MSSPFLQHNQKFGKVGVLNLNGFIAIAFQSHCLLFWVDNGFIANMLLAFRKVLLADESANFLFGYGGKTVHNFFFGRYLYYNFALAISSFSAGNLALLSRRSVI